jgi:predicted transcriptional regulator
MAKPSRSKRSQPAFDSSELEDLIFTPAVGSGVGSYLLATVDISKVTTDDKIGSSPHNNTLFDMSTVAEVATDATTATIGKEATVVKSDSLSIWTTEAGEVVPASRVKRIRLAEHVLNSAEESVYDALWTAKAAIRDEFDTARTVQAGYDFLVKKTRLSKRTIQRIVDRLMEKDFIAIERPADIYQRTATVYRVFSHRSILERQAAKGRFYVVKIGPGLLYAHPLSGMSRVVHSDLTTEATPATGTVDSANQTTVVKADTATPSSEAGNSTLEEVTYFVEHELPAVRDLLQETAARREAWYASHAYWSRVAEDPAQTDEARAEARKVLATLANVR